LISKKSKFLALNAQINAANRGFHTMDKYQNLNCVIINETELRHELRDKNSKINSLMIKLSNKIGIEDLVVTMGSEGASLYNRKLKKFYDIEAFATKIIDKIGSGDTMLSLLAILLKLNIDKTYSLLVGSLAASQSVGIMGNKNLIDKIKLLKAIDHTLK
ncbi:PfkB family carbohydrate kinase, partial [Candidatus Pelagibacter sp.]|nr:PfkB family carbohydrate kinase [Candidatus Pelagibacter sp.]